MSAQSDDYERHDEPMMQAPDGGRRVRKPEFYRARAQVQQQMANEAKTLASQHESAAIGYRKRAEKCESLALLMEQWAAEGETAHSRHDSAPRWGNDARVVRYPPP